MMKFKIATMKNFQHSKPLTALLVIIGANYAAQVPYYLHQYYAPRHLLPSLIGALLLLATLVWFLSAYRLLAKGSRTGWWLMSTYLLIVFLFYIQTQVMQLATAHQILLYVYRPKGILLFIVFGIGYINCLAAAYYATYMLIKRKDLMAYPRESQLR
jgi:hypothetical protein